VADLAKTGQTMIIVTHSLGFARSVADTIHVMHAGTVAESGPPAQIFDNPQQEVTRTFLDQARND
jgi:ABC-type polar amino acid transport system ATPase subunit